MPDPGAVTAPQVNATVPPVAGVAAVIVGLAIAETAAGLLSPAPVVVK